MWGAAKVSEFKKNILKAKTKINSFCFCCSYMCECAQVDNKIKAKKLWLLLLLACCFLRERERERESVSVSMYVYFFLHSVHADNLNNKSERNRNSLLNHVLLFRLLFLFHVTWCYCEAL